MKPLSHRLLVYSLMPIVLLGPLSMDIYLPAIASIRSSLNASDIAVQWTLSSFVLGFGLCQLFVGMLSAVFGASRCLGSAIVVYGIACLGCSFSTTIYAVIAFRFLQAIAACTTLVLSMALVRRLAEDTNDNQRAYSILSASTALAPIFAPILGAQILQSFRYWQSVFVFLMFVSLLSYIIYQLKIKNVTATLSTSVFHKNAYSSVLKSSNFWVHALVGAAGMTILFSFFSVAPLILIHHYHFSAQQFSVIFGLYGTFFLSGNLLSSKWCQLIGSFNGLRCAYGMILFLSFLVTLIPFFHQNVYLFLSFIMLINFFVGITFGPAMAGAMEPFQNIAEQAASIYGFQQFVIAFLIGTALVFFGWTSPLHIGVEIIMISLILLLLLLLLPDKKYPKTYGSVKINM